MPQEVDALPGVVGFTSVKGSMTSVIMGWTCVEKAYSRIVATTITTSEVLARTPYAHIVKRALDGEQTGGWRERQDGWACYVEGAGRMTGVIVYHTGTITVCGRLVHKVAGMGGKPVTHNSFDHHGGVKWLVGNSGDPARADRKVEVERTVCPHCFVSNPATLTECGTCGRPLGT